MVITGSSNTIYDVRSVSTIFVGMSTFFYDIRSMATIFVVTPRVITGIM